MSASAACPQSKSLWCLCCSGHVCRLRCDQRPLSRNLHPALPADWAAAPPDSGRARHHAPRPQPGEGRHSRHGGWYGVAGQDARMACSALPAGQLHVCCFALLRPACISCQPLLLCSCLLAISLCWELLVAGARASHTSPVLHGLATHTLEHARHCMYSTLVDSMRLRLPCPNPVKCKCWPYWCAGADREVCFAGPRGSCAAHPHRCRHTLPLLWCAAASR